MTEMLGVEEVLGAVKGFGMPDRRIPKDDAGRGPLSRHHLTIN